MPYGQSVFTANHVVLQVSLHVAESFRRGWVCQPRLIGVLGKNPDFFDVALSVLEGI